jgi:uncharacterized protein YydD (DUF2326 family)
VSSNEEKIKMLMDKLEQQEAQRLEDAKAEEAQPPAQEEPPHPQFEDKLKQLREDIAKNYEDKMNRGFEEIQEIKKDMENKQEIYETQQIRDLRREIKRLQSALADSQNETADRDKQIEVLK